MAKNIKKTSTDDKVLFYYYKAVEYFQNNSKTVYIALTVIVLIAAGIFFYINNKKAAEEEANMELVKVQRLYDQQKYDQAINGDSAGTTRGLLYIVNEYGSTESGNTAKLLLGNSYFALLDFDNALKYYDSYSGSNLIYKATSLAGVAAVYEAKLQYLEAAQQFAKAAGINPDIALNDQFLYYAARNYSKVNDKDGYMKVLEKLRKDYPKSTYIALTEKFEGLFL